MMIDFDYDIRNISTVANRILEAGGDIKIFTFTGELGSGKTTLISEICRNLGSTEPISSPTFSLINEYATGASTIYHMDMYRIKSIQEAIEAGVEDYIHSGEFCMIEWPEKIDFLLPPEHLSILVTPVSHMMRNLKIELHK